MKEKKFSAEDIIVERINEKHDISKFKSYEKELVDFLKEDALENQRLMISNTYLFIKKENKEIMGYITILNDALKLEGNLKTMFKEKNIFYKSLPALKIGRLCVDDNFLRRGLGTLMIGFAIQKAHSIYKNHSGCRFIVLDAKTNKEQKNNSLHFYKKVGFKVLKERKKGTIPMYLDLYH